MTSTSAEKKRTAQDNRMEKGWSDKGRGTRFLIGLGKNGYFKLFSDVPQLVKNYTACAAQYLY